ncbi:MULTISPECIES: DNA methyltransferase [Bacteroides]|uniref:class I SAM-dependent DNA methyltransferase n=1 Tax=Bacteroides TaxID=816 RepID=UPI00259C6987|nr:MULTISPECIES: DNA methyltransferase [Bacteroides]
MATTISYQDIEKRLTSFKESFPIEEIPYILLKAFGTTDAYIKRYKDGKGIISGFNGVLIKGLLAYRQVATEALISELEIMKNDPVVLRAKPRLLITSDGSSIQAYDPKEKESYDNKLKALWLDFQFFYPLAGVERYRGVDENPADVKAAEKMAKLHDEIRRYNEFSSGDDLHDLNIFMTRLLFCFFAEDTGIFEENLFTASISRYTQEDGSDLSEYLSACFNIMDKDLRVGVPSVITQFPYVNGGLFHKQISIPKMGYRARKLILECGGLNWKDINPDIFGSMIQAVVSPSQRGSLGMHYTSVPNIMKVIQPLFLDDLYEEFTKVKDSVKGLRQLLVRISKMKFFDPACGSGNFLIIAYKELRKLEILIWKQISSLKGQYEIPFVNIQLNQFYGIEIDDFAHEVAMLSLWLAEHQMNCMFTREFTNVQIPALPLRTNGNIVQGNACRVDWNEVCPHTGDEEVFVFGNPPYLGSSMQSSEQKGDKEYVLGNLNSYKDLDYIACWFYLGAVYIHKTTAKYAFVSTNSICQGEQVAMLWKPILGLNLEINFAYTSFKWDNNAKGKAQVIVIIVGVTSISTSKKLLFNNEQCRFVKNINCYLLEGNNTIVVKRSSNPSISIQSVSGNKATDDGKLILNVDEKNELIKKYGNTVSKYIYQFTGSKEFIRGELRYCLMISNEEFKEADKIPELHNRFEHIRSFRLKSTENATRITSERPYSFFFSSYRKEKSIIIPATSSENRAYIPMGILNSNVVVSNSANVVYGATLWLFGILTSKMHMAWVKTVGGRLKTDYRYSAQLCYNTFPFPKISKEKEKQIESAAEEVLLCREDYPDKTLADLYDPDKMPDNLRQAHHALDLIVESCYQDKPFENDEERLECLFKLYEKMTKKEK